MLWGNREMAGCTAPAVAQQPIKVTRLNAEKTTASAKIRKQLGKPYWCQCKTQMDLMYKRCILVFGKEARWLGMIAKSQSWEIRSRTHGNPAQINKANNNVPFTCLLVYLELRLRIRCVLTRPKVDSPGVRYIICSFLPPECRQWKGLHSQTRWRIDLERGSIVNYAAG